MLIQFIEYKAFPRPTPLPPAAAAVPTVQFRDLPLEIRELIWEYALSDSRVFHVKQVVAEPYRHQTASPLDPRPGRILFHKEHRPLVATQVCTEARRVAWRIGCFLFRRPGHDAHPGIWCNPRSDVLYIDRNARNAFPVVVGSAVARDSVSGAGAVTGAATDTSIGTEVESVSGAGPTSGHDTGIGPTISIPGLERMQHLALEWRWFLQDGSLPLSQWSSEAMQAYWAAKTDRLYAYLPALQTLTWVLPVVRHRGGLPWGREPTDLLPRAAHLVELPPATIVPIESGHRPWLQVESELCRTLTAEWQVADKQAKFGESICYPPEIEGRWLLRQDAPMTFDCHSTVRAFTA